ncbi:MAG: glycerophosphodiester phosphodiesterase [bacterium]|nr:glycerophosphodiester phosphodiesterase [bacterium]
MKNIKVIGHRGARGLETENTLESIKKALDLGVDGVEFDVWTTKDGVPVLHHDENLVRMTGENKRIPEISWDELKKIRTRDGKNIPTAQEAIELIGDKSFIFFEVKDRTLTPAVLRLLKDNKNKVYTVTSFEWPVLVELKKAMPDLQLYPATSSHPFKAISFAHRHKFHGVNIKYFWISPFTFWLTRHYGLKFKLYTVNNPLFVRLLRALRLDVDFMTDFPNRFKR